MRGSGPPRLLLRSFVQAPQRTVPNVVDLFGIANPKANVTVRVLGGTTYTVARKGDYYHHPLMVGNNVYPQIEVKSLYGLEASCMVKIVGGCSKTK